MFAQCDESTVERCQFGGIELTENLLVTPHRGRKKCPISQSNIRNSYAIARVALRATLPAMLMRIG